ncbi:MAG: FAD-dependent oxidoreductase [Chloroflexota bacterium]|nr:FAD-dependent oxidoreductase [Chloroflexota bacterium]
MTTNGQRNGHNGSAAPVGAVMVVGGGIAGMQSSLDLADAGYKVYLVETQSAIGGHMAQLDKTFPTNDCAMCTISPKLVEVGRHPNIHVMVDSEVTGIDGQAGNFHVEVKRKARYVDVDKCTGCGECLDVCPVVLPPLSNVFDEALLDRRAVYRLYPQAVPSAVTIDKLGVSPCRDACPISQRAQGYIALIREGRYADALRVILEDNPFPGICGRICNHRCEDACNRGLVDDPIAIASLKRFVTDMVYKAPREPLPRRERTKQEEIAIIGAGPCGLTAARDLVRDGYGVTVFETLPVAGGMLRVGVPEYRLPSWIIEREVQNILDEGVTLKLNHRVEDIDSLFDQGFDSVIIAVGAHVGKKLPIPGSDLEGVLLNTVFLRDVRLGNLPKLGKRVVVLGGGNVAIDVARTVVRLGVPEVHLACLESREKMPSHQWEIEDAEAEGVIMHPAHAFNRILDDGSGHVAGIDVSDVSFMEFDAEGRLVLETVPDSEHVIDGDTIIFSIGQAAGLAFIPEDSGVGTTRQGLVAVNPNTLAATRPGVFAAGDAVTGTAFVVDGIAAGHQAAESVKKFLQGEELEPKPRPDLPVVTLTEEEVQATVESGLVSRTGRIKMPELDVDARRNSFAEVDLGYNEALAQEEAARCLACGHCSECLSCWYICGVDAIDHDMVETHEQVNVGAVILAPGYTAYNPAFDEEYGFGRYPNVVTSLQLERLLSASGPTFGHVNRPSDGKPAHKIAFLQCIGSRDQNHDYCSAVCCMYATKEAIMCREHDPEVACHVFMMDMRAYSKGYYEYYKRAEDRYDIQYTRCRVSELKHDLATDDLILRYQTDDGKLVAEAFDMVVLSVGMEMSQEVKTLGRDLGIQLDDYGFCTTVPFKPLGTSKAGIFACGPFVEPKDIPETVVEASGAAAMAERLLAPARGTLITPVEYPPERDIVEEEPRVGVFVCHCGSNIGGFLDVPDVAEYAKDLPGVVHSEHNLYTCSQDSIVHITEQTKALGLNRVVVASCTPRTHEGLFQDSIRQAGLNPYLFDMANIRNQVSWVHSDNWGESTEKAKDLVRMAVARATHLNPLHKETLQVQQKALVVGGGVAGMSAALTLSEQGFPVDLVERTGELGGNLRHLHFMPDEMANDQQSMVNDQLPIANSQRSAVKDQTSSEASLTIDNYSPQAFLADLLASVKGDDRITVHLNTELADTTGFTGNFTSRLRRNPPSVPSSPEDGRNGQAVETITIQHGVTIVATGGQEYRGNEYGLGQDSRVVTGLEFEVLLAEWSGEQRIRGAEDQWVRESGDQIPHSAAFLLCVGPAENYCGRTCCTSALKQAIKLKELNPAVRITVLYKDIRTYGFKERLYTRARELGVVFMRYDEQHRPEVGGPGDQRNGGTEGQRMGVPVEIRAWEPAFDEWITLTADLLVLSVPMVPAEGTHELGMKLKLPIDLNGWFLEAHPKLRPVDFASDGFYMAGAAHFPKFVDEAIAQAQAAAARAATVLSHETMTVGGAIAQVDPQLCVGCLTCVRVCPYGVPTVDGAQSGIGGILGAALINPAMCHGCGVCMAECPARAIQLMHYRDDQVEIKIDALFGLERLD